jgi:putative endonuclease
MNSLNKAKSESIKQIGSFGEKMACDWLVRKGYTVLARNFHAQGGEIDIVAFLARNKEIVFVEVKTRCVRSLQAGSARPERAVTLSKKRKMKAAARRFFVMHNQYFNFNYSFDIVSVEVDKATRQARIVHFRGSAM